METIKIYRRETFNSAHRLFQEGLTDLENYTIYGTCSNPNSHGHNYVIEVWIEGEIDPKTGYLIDLKDLKKIIQEEVCDRFDHKNLNLDCPEFMERIPTTENIAIVCWQLIRPHLEAHLSLEVIISETEKNKAAYKGK